MKQDANKVPFEQIDYFRKKNMNMVQVTYIFQTDYLLFRTPILSLCVSVSNAHSKSCTQINKPIRYFYLISKVLLY